MTNQLLLSDTTPEFAAMQRCELRIEHGSFWQRLVARAQMRLMLLAQALSEDAAHENGHRQNGEV